VYAEIVRHLHQSEEVRILVNGKAGERNARAVLSQLPLKEERIRFFHIPTDRVWTRDYGPISTLATKDDPSDWTNRAVVAFQFNAWAKYPNYKRDAWAVYRMERHIPAIRLQNADSFHVGRENLDRTRVVLEGGSIDVNGLGCLLTTEECLL